MPLPEKTWRDLLRERLDDSGERMRISRELNVNFSTLWRWVAPGSTQKPRVAYLLKLPELFPTTQQGQIRHLLAEEYPEVFPTTTENAAREEEALVAIPSLYYQRVLSALQESDGLSTWAALTLGLKQLATQLVSEREKTSLYLMQISPSQRTLYLREGMIYDDQATLPFSGSSLTTLFFVGSASAPAEAVLTKKVVARGHGELAYPLSRRGKVVGSLWMTTQASFGFSQVQCQLGALYASLFSACFWEKDFYRTDQLSLVPMPSREEQIKWMQQMVGSGYLYSVIDPEAENEKQLIDLETRMTMQGGCFHD
ncbi:hypothetical protein KSF_086770 [Reticulibacter mediterranei]|uniref:GAF domain-containing protein n=1 Tax=Reticulibacter mediterranei TaxID=2778369 RepID=A0A8J3IVI4_9CHLR|nr:hypothetical protein [Reticulibacter mediterranei]GHO98629.1 hypothetical protein KSF_086770 [Reticulibacter mediterranei]